MQRFQAKFVYDHRQYYLVYTIHSILLLFSQEILFCFLARFVYFIHSALFTQSWQLWQRDNSSAHSFGPLLVCFALYAILLLPLLLPPPYPSLHSATTTTSRTPSHKLRGQLLLSVQFHRRVALCIFKMIIRRASL